METKNKKLNQDLISEIKKFLQSISGEKASNEKTEVKKPYIDTITGQINIKIPKITSLNGRINSNSRFVFIINPSNDTIEDIKNSKFVMFSTDDEKLLKKYEHKDKSVLDLIGNTIFYGEYDFQNAKYLNDIKGRILSFLHVNRESTLQKISDGIGFPHITIKKYLDELEKLGVISSYSYKTKKETESSSKNKRGPIKIYFLNKIFTDTI